MTDSKRIKRIACTAHPRCAEPAAFTLLNMKSREVLGYNCEQHANSCAARTTAGVHDYDLAPLPNTTEDLTQWYVNSHMYDVIEELWTPSTQTSPV